MTPDPLDILAHASPRFVAAALERGVPADAALAIYRRAFREGAFDADAVPWASLPLPQLPHHVTEQQHGRAGPHETIKFIQRRDDGLETESVIIPMIGSSGRRTATLCVSSQIGCAMGCTFCETARMGLMKNLTAREIIAQWFAARFTFGVPVKNIVFMGMGEPMDNLEAVLEAITILCDHNGPSISAAAITVSTVGRPDGIRRLGVFAEQPGFRKLNLAVSINAPNDAIRRTIMPIARAHPLDELLAAMHAWPRRRNAAICVEYVLIPGVNDEPDHADELADRLRTLRSTVNVIPYNPRRDSPWPAPSEESVERFLARLRAQGQFAKRRGTKGRSVMAACGQLGNPAIRQRRVLSLSEVGQMTPPTPSA